MALIELARFASPVEASIVRGRLEAAGISCVIFDDGMSIVYGGGSVIASRLMVLDEDYATALEELA